MPKATLYRIGMVGIAALLGFWSSTILFAQAFPTTGPSQKVICLVCIGDSITAGSSLPDAANQCAPVVLARELANGSPAGTAVFLTNVGKSGTTTEDWIPPKGLVNRADKAAAKLMADHPTGQMIFSIMLGTNDSANHGPHGSPVADERYRQNLKAITDLLASKYPDCRIFIHHAIFYSKNTHNTSDYEGNSAHDRLLSYFPQIDALIADDAKAEHRHLFAGDVGRVRPFHQKVRDRTFAAGGQERDVLSAPECDWCRGIGKVLGGGDFEADELGESALRPTVVV